MIQCLCWRIFSHVCKIINKKKNLGEGDFCIGLCKQACIPVKKIFVFK